MLLVVERDPKFAGKLKKHLSFHGKQIFFVEGFKDAIFLLKSVNADFIVANLNGLSSNEDGEKLCALARKSGTPILFIEGKRTVGVAEELRQWGQQHFIKLPFKVSDLAKRIHELEKKGESLVGKTIGPSGQEVRITGRLGAGSMGTVYEGFQPSLRRKVAVKFLSEGYQRSDPEAARRFENEARAIAGLRDDHIVRIYFIDTHEGRPYSVMELIEGPPLDQHLKSRGRLKLFEALRLCHDILTGLSVAHRAGKVHRDIKPGNIMLNAQGQAVLLDFGLVRELTAASVTQQGTVLGTPRYIAPELVQGKPVDPRADLYSVGIILYEMLVGFPPFNGKDFVSILMKHVNEPLPDPQKFGQFLDERLFSIIKKMTAKNPESRYRSAAEILSIIDDFLATLDSTQLETTPLDGISPKMLEVFSGLAINDDGETLKKFGSIEQDRAASLHQMDNLITQIKNIDGLGAFVRGTVELEDSKMLIFPYEDGLAGIESSSPDASSQFHRFSTATLKRILNGEAAR